MPATCAATTANAPTAPSTPSSCPPGRRGILREESGVYIAGPNAIDGLLATIDRDRGAPPVPVGRFLSEDAYRPLPTIVQAARELMQSGRIRTIHRARAATEPTLHELARIIREAARTRTRRLVLVTGVPGAGKTLVGLQIVHADFLDDLAATRANGSKPTAPAVFLSGNGPLVDVLQYELRSAGGGGKTFVRGVKDYVKTYSRSRNLVPPEHVLVFDEAQRAFDAEEVAERHRGTPGFEGGRSEPEHFIEFAERVPDWCVVVGLIGSGQEIHIGEEAGLGQWRQAVDGCKAPGAWKAHLPLGAAEIFRGSSVPIETSDVLNLDTEIRFHAARDLHEFVAGLLERGDVGRNADLAAALEKEAYHLRITRDLDTAGNYLRERFGEAREKRFGLIASARDRDLERFGIPNGYHATRDVTRRIGQWYGDDEDAPGGFSCRHLRDAITEFGAQGLELDACLLAWGTDFVREAGAWSDARARGYRKPARIKSPYQLRLNAYRVLLTRGRDATVVFVPPIPLMNETFAYLRDSGFRPI